MHTSLRLSALGPLKRFFFAAPGDAKMDGMIPFGRGDAKCSVVPFGLDTPPWLGPTRSRAIPTTRRGGEACRCVHRAPPPPSRGTPRVIPSATAELHPARLPCSTSPAPVEEPREEERARKLPQLVGEKQGRERGESRKRGDPLPRRRGHPPPPPCCAPDDPGSHPSPRLIRLPARP
jgi:hypothetical protein